MPTFSGDIEVVRRSRLRIHVTQERKPTKAQMLELLQSGEYDDITDEEDLFYAEVRKMDLSAEDEDGAESDIDEDDRLEEE